MNKFKNGFTIVELLIAMVVGMIIMTAIYAMINLGQGSSAGVGRRVMTQQDSRAVLDLTAMEVSMVSFNPSMNNATWTGPMVGSCNAVGMNAVRRGIQVASNTTLGLAMDLSANMGIGDVPNEYIVYTYNSANTSITRSANCGPAQTILGGPASGSTATGTIVRNNLTGTPLFQYFSVAGTELFPTGTPLSLSNADIPLIRRIRINIIADDQINDTQGGGFKVSRRTYSTDVLVRNHAMAP
jgi:prepilin-type N-terminal cleavage/methylation domain-containing protein